MNHDPLVVEGCDSERSLAVLEGVAFSLRDLLELMAAVGLESDRAQIAGGGARSPLWQQIVADVLGNLFSL